MPLSTPPPGGSQDKRSQRKHHLVSPPGPLSPADDDRDFSAPTALYSEREKGP